MRALVFMLFLLWGQAWGATYYADPAGGGAASCVDSGANVCTLTRCTAVASTGDTCQLACGTYDLSTTGVNFVKNITYQAATTGCATLVSSNATRTVALNPANNATALILDGLVIENTGGATANTMQVGDQAFDATVEVRNTTLAAGTSRHFNDAYTRGVVKLSDITLTGAIGSVGGIVSSVTPSAAKKLSIDGVRGSLTTTTNALANAILVQRAAGSSTSFWAYINDINIDCTAPPELGALAACMVIRADRITSGTNLGGVTERLIIANVDSSATATAATTNDSGCVVVSGTDATAVAHSPWLHDIDCDVNSPVSRAVSIGIDGVTTSYVDDALLENITMNGTFYNGVATPHGLSIGRVNRGEVRGLYVTGFAVGALVSMNQGARLSGGIIRGSTYAPIFVKGSGATTAPTVQNFTVLMDDRVFGARHGAYGCIGVAEQSGTNNAAASFTNVACNVSNGANWKHVVVDALQVANFDGNNYRSDETLSDAWSYQGATYATLALWNAAATVGTDKELSPGFIGGTSPTNADGFCLDTDSTLLGAGTYIGAWVLGYGGESLTNPPQIGARELCNARRSTPTRRAATR